MIKVSYLDNISIGLSALCTLHCLIVPVLVVFSPVLVSNFMDDHFHEYMLVAVLPISTVALFLGCRKHKNPIVALTGFCGLFLLVVVSLQHGTIPLYMETCLSIIAASIIAVSHYFNHRLCRSVDCKCITAEKV